MTLKVGADGLVSGSLSVVEAVLAPGHFVGPHTHSREDEVTLVLAGRIVALVGGTVTEAGVGALLLKPVGVMHAFGNPGPEPALVHEFHAPGGLEEFYASMQDALAEPDLTMEDRREAFLAGAVAFGVELHPELDDDVRARLGL